MRGKEVGMKLLAQYICKEMDWNVAYYTPTMIATKTLCWILSESLSII